MCIIAFSMGGSTFFQFLAKLGRANPRKHFVDFAQFRPINVMPMQQPYDAAINLLLAKTAYLSSFGEGMVDQISVANLLGKRKRHVSFPYWTSGFRFLNV